MMNTFSLITSYRTSVWYSLFLYNSCKFLSDMKFSSTPIKELNLKLYLQSFFKASNAEKGTLPESDSDPSS